MEFIVGSLALIIICCIVIWRASDGFETASSYLGRHLSMGVRGATINAIGSSMPELLTTLFFLFVLDDRDGFAGGIGTTAGSAIFNGMIIPALVILVVLLNRLSKGVNVSRRVLFRDGIALLTCELVLIFLLGGTMLYWGQGLILMLLYAAYGFLLIRSLKPTPTVTQASVQSWRQSIEKEGSEGRADQQGPNLKIKGEQTKRSTFESFQRDASNQPMDSKLLPEEARATPLSSTWWKNLLTLDLESLIIPREINRIKAWGLLLISMGIIALACFFLVRACEWFGEAIGVRVYIVAVILASAATSVPDTFISIRDARKGNYDDAVSNALGSNIFDICFALGLPLFLYTIIYGPIHMSPTSVQDVSELRILLFLLTFAAFLVYVSQKRLGLYSALMLLALYGFFTLYIIGDAQPAHLRPAAIHHISEILGWINEIVDSLRFWK